MKKKQIEVVILLAYLGVLGSQSMSVEKCMPKQLKCENGGGYGGYRGISETDYHKK